MNRSALLDLLIIIWIRQLKLIALSKQLLGLILSFIIIRIISSGCLRPSYDISRTNAPCYSTINQSSRQFCSCINYSSSHTIYNFPSRICNFETDVHGPFNCSSHQIPRFISYTSIWIISYRSRSWSSLSRIHWITWLSIWSRRWNIRWRSHRRRHIRLISRSRSGRRIRIIRRLRCTRVNIWLIWLRTSRLNRIDASIWIIMIMLVRSSCHKLLLLTI